MSTPQETFELGPDPAPGDPFAPAPTEIWPLPAANSAGGATAGPWPVGARFGSIRVVRRIAVGGMGEVFEGFDESLRRRVALKALRRDRLSPEARARLLFEARVLSQLSDPRICQVYGWIEDRGGEFLVLELIEGETLDGYFAKGRPRAMALRLAAELAEVLKASHRKGVIHRDLKPSNLMVTRAGKLKVLDFGISSVISLAEPPSGAAAVLEGSGGAERLDLGPDDDALRSRAGVIIGTIHYMSPEQARGDKVTAASDLYSFGVVLEELLTGRPPHPEDAGVLEILIRLQKGERPMPAGLEPALADLILRLTARAPEARPTAADVVEKLAAIRDAPRRRLRQALAAGLVVLALSAGLWHTRRLTVERNLARAAEQRALAAHRESEEIANFLESMFAGADPVKADGKQITVREVLDRGTERIHKSLADQPAVRARLLATIGRASSELGLLDRAEAALTEAIALQEKIHGPDSREVGEDLVELANVRREQDRHAEACALRERALGIARKLEGEAGPAVADRLLELGECESRQAHYERAEALIRESLAMRESGPAAAKRSQALSSLANLMRNRGRYAEALEVYQQALAFESPGEGKLSDRGTLRYNIGITLSQLGRFPEAETTLKQALEMWTQVFGAESGSVAKVELALATIDRQNGNFAAAEKRYLAVLAIWTQINGPNSTNVAFGLNNLGNNYLEQGEKVRAEQKYRAALEIFESRLGKSHPNVAMTLANLGRCLVGQNRHSEAIPILWRVVAIDEKTGGPHNADLGWDRLFLAQALWHQDRAAARTEVKAGLEILEREVGRDHPELRKWMEENPELLAP